MKLTADTITDEQIKALLKESEGIEQNDIDLARLCYIALGQWYRRRRGAQAEARGRCAEIINARKGGV